jgi:hypothetical protein
MNETRGTPADRRTCNSISSTEYKIQAEREGQEIKDANVKLVLGYITGVP